MSQPIPYSITGNDDPSGARLEATLNTVARHGTVTDVVPHRHGRGPVDDIVTHGPSTSQRFRVDEIDGLDNTVAIEAKLNELDAIGYELFQLVAHREGQSIVACIVTTNARRLPRSEWIVLEGEDYREALEQLLNDQTRSGWTLHSIIPHRIKRGNIPVVVMHRPTT